MPTRYRIVALAALVAIFGLGFASPGFASGKDRSYGYQDSHGKRSGYDKSHRYKEKHGYNRRDGKGWRYGQKRHDRYDRHGRKQRRGGYGHSDRSFYFFGQILGGHERRISGGYGQGRKSAKGCHRVIKTGYDGGRKARFGGTMCYDAYGKSYIVRGSRHVIHYYR